jgi:hypothetical protein
MNGNLSAVAGLIERLGLLDHPLARVMTHGKPAQ